MFATHTDTEDFTRFDTFWDRLCTHLCVLTEVAKTLQCYLGNDLSKSTGEGGSSSFPHQYSVCNPVKIGLRYSL